MEIAFLGSQHEQCLEAERRDRITASVHQCLHYVLTVHCRNTDLETHLSGIANALHARRQAEKCTCRDGHMRQCLGRKVDVGLHFLQQAAGVRTCYHCYSPLAGNR